MSQEEKTAPSAYSWTERLLEVQLVGLFGHKMHTPPICLPYRDELRLSTPLGDVPGLVTGIGARLASDVDILCPRRSGTK